MTTFEDLDLTDAFGDDFSSQEQPARRRHGWITAVALVLAVLLVGGGLIYLATASTGPAPATEIAATEAVPALTKAQAPADVVSSIGLDGTGITSASTRYLGETELGRLYVGTGTGGKLCLLAVPTGDLPSASCVQPRTDSVVELRPEHEGAGVMLVTGTGKAPAAADGWRETSPGLWQVAAS